MGEAKKKKEAAKKGVYTEYLDARLNQETLLQKRRVQLSRISKLRGRDVLVFASDISKGNVPGADVDINYRDLMPLKDQIAVLNGTQLDVILETPGGSAEVAEDIVDLLRERFDGVSFIIPGWAKSAGTIMAMAGDEILMEPSSALGPIDAQITNRGKLFSAEALLEGLEKIKKESDKHEALNRAYIPILQHISPGEIQRAKNSLAFAKNLVARWLYTYKFKNWTKHGTSDKAVSGQERQERAERIASDLSKHQHWLTHGRSIKIQQLEELGLKIINYSDQPDLNDAIRRYYTLMQMTFESSIYKLFETPISQIARGVMVRQQVKQSPIKYTSDLTASTSCPACKRKINVQLKFSPTAVDKPGCLPYPANDLASCPHCGHRINMKEMRQKVEQQAGKQVIR